MHVVALVAVGVGILLRNLRLWVTVLVWLSCLLSRYVKCDDCTLCAVDLRVLHMRRSRVRSVAH